MTDIRDQYEDGVHGLDLKRDSKDNIVGTCKCGVVFRAEPSIHAQDLVESAHRRHLIQERQLAEGMAISGGDVVVKR